MVEWEYKVVALTFTGKEPAEIHERNEETLNSLGKQGWELVAVTETSAYLKRRK